MNGAQALRSVLAENLQDNPRLHVVGEALELSPATSGLLALDPERVHLLPAADASLMGVCVGLAISGQEVVVELADTEAIWGALQQLAQEAEALTHATEYSVTLVVRVPWTPGRPDPSSLLYGLRGLQLAAAGGPGDAAELLAAALVHRGITVILEPGEAMAEHGASVPGTPRPLGQARVVRAGAHATALAWGPGVGAATSAAEQLAEEGIELEVVDLRCLAPLDAASLQESVRRTGRPVLVGAPSGLLTEVIHHAFLRLESPPALASADPADVVAKVRASVTF